MKESTINVQNPMQLERAISDARNMLIQQVWETPAGEPMGYSIVIQSHMGELRTDKQDGARWLWMRRYAKALNDAGVDMRQYFEGLREGADLPWTAEAFAEIVWKPILQAMTGQASSTQSGTKDVQLIAETVAKFIAGRYGVDSPHWPTEFGRQMEAEQ